MASNYEAFKTKANAQQQSAHSPGRAPVEETRDGLGLTHTSAMGLQMAAASSSSTGAQEVGFKMAGRPFKQTRLLLASNFLKNKATKKAYDLALEKPSHDDPQNRNRTDDVLDKIISWSNGKYPFERNPTSYKDLWAKAVGEVAKDRNAAAGPQPDVSPNIVRNQADNADTSAALSLSGDKKIDSLKQMHGYSSDIAEDTTRSPRRDREKVKRYYHRDDPEKEYTVTGAGHFLLGGPGGKEAHSYKGILKGMERETGKQGKALAKHLIAVLQGGKASGDHNAMVRKFAMIASTSELYRSGINPVALQAALFDISENGGDVLKRLNEQVLYMAAQGGSKRSQFHREGAPVDDEEFNRIATAQHDALVKYAGKLGYGTDKPEDIKNFIELATRSALEGRKKFVRESGKTDEPSEKDKKQELDSLTEPDSSVEVAPVLPATGNDLSASEPVRASSNPSVLPVVPQQRSASMTQLPLTFARELQSVGPPRASSLMQGSGDLLQAASSARGDSAVRPGKGGYRYHPYKPPQRKIRDLKAKSASRKRDRREDDNDDGYDGDDDMN